VTFSLCEDSRLGVVASVPPRLSSPANPQTRQELPHKRLGVLLLDKLIREAHNLGHIRGEGQPLRSRSTQVFSAVLPSSAQLLTVRDSY